MKLLTLGLRRFGHFNNTTLQLEGGLCLILGQNEAGKTTALKAVRSLLFGVQKQASHLALGFDQAQIAIEGTVVFASGHRAALVRTKNPPSGQKTTLNGKMLAGGDEIDEEWLKDKLGRPTADMYEQIFAFSLDALEKGADLLSNQAVKGALYGAGLGGVVKPSEVLARLEEEKDALFTERGKKPLNLAKAKLAELAEKVRAVSQGSDAYSALEGEQEGAAAAAEEKRRELDHLYRSTERTKALRSALDVHREREANARELASLAVPTGFDPELGARALAAYGEEAKLALADEDARRKIAALAEEDAALVVDDGLLSKAVAIEALAQKVGAEWQTRAELVELTHEETRSKSDAARQLANLRPGWTLERLTALALDEATVRRLRDLLEKETSLQTSIKEAAASEASSAEAAAREEHELAALAATSAGESTAALEAWLAQQASADALQAQIEDAAKTLSLVEKKRETARIKLDPRPAAGGDLERILPPTIERIDVVRATAVKIEADRAKAVERIATADQAIARAAAEIAAIDANERAPSEAELAEARARRDRLADELFAAFDPTNVPLYKSTVLKADELVDQMRWRAEAVQRRALQERDRARATADRESADQARHVAEGLADTHARSWRALWSSTGVEPVDPDRMRAWRLAWDDLVALGPDLAEATARVTMLREREAAFVREGAALLGPDAPPAAATTLRTLQTIAAARVATAQARTTAQADKQAAVLQHRRTERAAQTRRAQLEAEGAAWTAAWKDASLAIAGPRETFSTAEARAVLDPLVALQRKLVADAEKNAARQAKLTAAHAGFERAVRDLLGESADAAATVEAAHAAAKRAQVAAARRSEIARATKDRTEQHAETVRELERARLVVQSAKQAAGTTDDATLRAIAERAREAEKLARSIEHADRELARLRGDVDADTFRAALAASTTAMLTAEHEALAADLDRVQKEQSALREKVGALEERRKTFDGGGAAAERAAELEGERALLKEQIERYAVAAIAHDVLTRGIRRFEREHQPRLLARAGELFRTMTEGSFVHVRQNLEGKLVVVRADERELEPTQLSTGTGEQLFLALRLAYIEAYARPGVEPLPVVLDDVLVNFDDARALATLRALVGFAETTQVLFFTCHAHLIALANEANLGVPVLTLERAVKGPNDQMPASAAAAEGAAAPTFELTPATDAGGSARRRRRSSGPG